MSLKPIKLYGGGQTPNPIKVAIILKELDLPYAVTGPQDWKSPSYLAINPNGKAPSIQDPNIGVTVFESCAILEYLIETYDTTHKLSCTIPAEKWLQKSWLYLQGTGQGPYFGQAGWFQFLHPEQLPSAIERYHTEAKRLVGVIDAHLATRETLNLVGDKVTYVDLAWVPWNFFLDRIVVPGWEYAGEYPLFAAWHRSLMDRDSVKRVFESKEFNYSLAH